MDIPSSPSQKPFPIKPEISSTGPLPPVPGSRRKIFAKRFLSSAILWLTLVSSVIINHQIGYFLLIAGVGLISLWEYFQMLSNKNISTFKMLGMILGCLFFVTSFYCCDNRPLHPFSYELPLICLFIFGLFVRQLFIKALDYRAIESIAYTTFGLLYVPFLLSFITKTLYLIAPHIPQHPSGCIYVVYMIVVAKFSDMGAYLVGSMIGRHKMIPHVSPSKTWEGFGGAILFSLIASVGLRALLTHQLSLLNWTDIFVLGIGLSIAAIIGDLAESILKRSTNVKDSGSALPGIGGILDLIDSLLFAAPLLYFYLAWKLNIL